MWWVISGCLRNQGKCWGNNKSPPLNGSREGRLECRSELPIIESASIETKKKIKKK